MEASKKNSDEGFEYDDLLWIKNVRREGGNGWAYMDVEVGDIFYLNWARGRANMGKTSALKPNVNELILLFQTIKNKAIASPNTYLTHIVTPINDDLIDDGSSHPYKRQMVVVAKDSNPIPKPTQLNFQQPNRGWTCDIDLIKPFKPSNTFVTKNDKQKFLWNLFSSTDKQIKRINKIQKEMFLSEQIEGVVEGEEKYKLGRHKYFERDPIVIAQKKKIAILNNTLICEVCRFDFQLIYGAHGTGFIECHHITPIAGNGKRITRIEDLALVCSNCHKMLHRRNTNGSYYSLNELSNLIENKSS